MPLVKQNVMKFEVFILGGQRIDQKRNKGWWRGSKEMIEGSTKGNLKRRIRNIDTCLCLFPQGAFLLSSRLDSEVKRCNLECNNTASTNVCRLDSRCSVNLFTAGLICNFTS